MSTGTSDLALAEENFLNKLAETVGTKANVANAFGEPITRNGGGLQHRSAPGRNRHA